jgi:NAD(P)H dehydrogenase (quinone)
MITVTGASGHLGRLVIADLLDRGIPADQIVAAVRDPGKVSDLAGRGVVVRAADYTEPESLGAALAGTDKLLLISSNLLGQRLPQHTNVVHAAVAEGVSLIAYTSIPYADTTSVALAPEHKATEAVIRASGLPFVFLRNSWYVETYTEHLDTAFQFGAILGAAGEGRVSAAPRADYAAAAAAVLAGEGPVDAVYELGGDHAFTLAELAAEVSRQSGIEIVYRDLPEEEYVQALLGAGLPEGYARALAGSDAGLAKGGLFVGSGHLRELIGRPTTPLAESVAAALKD